MTTPAVGDLSVSIRGCDCGHSKESIGSISKVISIEFGDDFGCESCKRAPAGIFIWAAREDNSVGCCLPLAWLVKYEPPVEFKDFRLTIDADITA